MASAAKKNPAVAAAERFFDLGVHVIPLKPGTKAPVNKDWTELRLTFPDFPNAFTNGHGIGALLNLEPDYHVDLDVDDLGALKIVAENLIPGQPPTGWVFGRKSKPRSHFIYRFPGEFKSVEFADGVNPQENTKRGEKQKHMMVELRGAKKQTAFPPTVHPAGETIEWVEKPTRENLGQPNIDGLLHWTAKVASATLLARHYPAFGDGHELALALAGWLGLAGWTEEDVTRLVIAAATIAGDPDLGERQRNVRSTFEDLSKGEKALTQRRHLEKLLGENGKEICAKITDWLSLRNCSARTAADAVIVVKTGESPAATDEAEQILLRHAERLRIFQRAGEVARIISLPKEVKSTGLTRPEGTIMLSALTVPALMETLERLIEFRVLVKKDEATGEEIYERINCPAKIPKYYLARRGSWKLPVLTGIVAAPLLRLDGTILTTEGYDESTGLFLVSGGNWLRIPEQPTPTHAKDALEILTAPFAEFPFVTDADKAVAIAAILTALERRLLGPCPLFGYSAPTPRSGKSKLAGAPAIIATGKPAPASSASPDKEEFRKALTSTLREGHLIVNLDNVEHAIKSPDLCKIITQDEFSDRLLGENTTLHLPTNVLWTATGNNLTFRGDLTTRVLLCDIDAIMEQPEHRSFKIPDFEDYLLRHRAEIVAAALTILRAFHVANRPKQEGKPWGGFDQWCAFIREPLIWVGLADPCETRDKVISDDPEKEIAVEVFTKLFNTFGNDEFTAREAAGKANEWEKDLAGYVNEELHDVLAAATSEKRDVNQTKLGWWLRSWRGRFVAGLRLVRTNPKGTHGAKWKFEGKLEEKK